MPASKSLTWRKAVAYLGIVVLIGLALLSRPHPAFFAVGTVLIVIGEFFRIWGCGHLEKNQRLVTAGPYAHVKNPLYLGTLLIMIGFACAATHPDEPSIWVLCGLLPFGLACYFIYYFPKKKRVEYDRLRRRFGEDAEEFIREVPHLIPRLTPYPNREKHPFSWSLVYHNSEVSTAFYCLCGLLLIGSKFFWSF